MKMPDPTIALTTIIEASNNPSCRDSPAEVATDYTDYMESCSEL